MITNGNSYRWLNSRIILYLLQFHYFRLTVLVNKLLVQFTLVGITLGAIFPTAGSFCWPLVTLDSNKQKLSVPGGTENSLSAFSGQKIATHCFPSLPATRFLLFDAQFDHQPVKKCEWLGKMCPVWCNLKSIISCYNNLTISLLSYCARTRRVMSPWHYFWQTSHLFTKTSQYFSRYQLLLHQ